MKIQNLVRSLHGYIGIVAGLLLVVMGLTGGVIVFQQELDRAFNPQLMQVSPQGEMVAVDKFLAAAQSSMPKARLESIVIPQTLDSTYKLSFKTEDEVPFELFVDPYTGKILGSRRSDRTLISMIYAIHHDLSAGKIGLYLVGISGLALILQSLTGILLWTGWRKLSKGFRIRWHSPMPLLNFDLHNVGGAISNIFLLILGFTGFVIVGAHILLEPPHTEAKLLPPAFQPLISVSQLMQIADQAMPDGKTTSISFPDRQTMVVAKKLPQDHDRFYFSSVTLDGKTGKVIEASKVTELPPMWKFLVPIADLHFGTIAGLPSRILYVFIGIVPLLLFITGIKMFKMRKWDRVKKKETRDLVAIAQNLSQKSDINH